MRQNLKMRPNYCFSGTSKLLFSLSTKHGQCAIHALYQLLKKDLKYTWTSAAQNAFDTVNEMITSDTVLTHYNPEVPVKLACDSSAYGLGVVISHVMENGEERSIAFASRTLDAAEKNYAQIQMETLAIDGEFRNFTAICLEGNLRLSRVISHCCQSSVQRNNYNCIPYATLRVIPTGTRL